MKNKNLDEDKTGQLPQTWSRRERRLAAATVISTCILLFLLIFGKTWEQRVNVSVAQTVTSQAVVVDGMQLALVDTVREQALAQTQIANLQDRSQIALARQLATQAQLYHKTDSSKAVTALQLSIMSMRLFPSDDAAQIVAENNLLRPVSFVEHSWLSTGVSIVGFSPDNRYLITLGQHDDAVHVWETETGREVCHVTHVYGAFGADISSDGKYVVSGGGDGQIRIWELETCKEISLLPHRTFVLSVEFSPDDQYVISRDTEGVTQIWNISSGEEIVRMENQPRDEAPLVKFTPNGRYMIDNAKEVTGDLTVLNTKRIIHEGHFGDISSDGKYILSGKCEIFLPSYACGQTLVTVWNIYTEEVEMSALYVGVLHSLTFSPDGSHILFAGEDEKVHIFEIETGNETVVLPHDATVYSAIFSTDGKYVLTNDSKGVIRKWVASTGVQVASAIQGRTGKLAFSPDGSYVASVDGLYVRVWKEGKDIEVARIDFGQKISMAALSPDGRYIAAGSENNVRLDNVVRVWEVGTGKEVVTLKLDRDITAIAFSPDGEYLAVGSYDHSVRMWSMNLKKEIVNMRHDDFAQSVSFSPDGKYILSNDNDHTVQVWSAVTGRRIANIEYFTGESVSVFSPDSAYVAATGCDLPDSYDPYKCEQSSLRVWSAATGQILIRVNYRGSVSLVGFSADGADVMIIKDNAVYVLNLVTGRETFKLFLGDLYLLSATASSDGMHILFTNVDGARASTNVGEFPAGEVILQMTDTRMAIFGHDGKYVISKDANENIVRVWGLNEREEIMQRSHQGNVSFISLSADGKYAVTSDGNVFYVWLYRPEDLIADACTRITRNLTRAEWTQYIGDILPYQATCPNLPIEP